MRNVRLLSPTVSTSEEKSLSTLIQSKMEYVDPFFQIEEIVQIIPLATSFLSPTKFQLQSPNFEKEEDSRHLEVVCFLSKLSGEPVIADYFSSFTVNVNTITFSFPKPPKRFKKRNIFKTYFLHTFKVNPFQKFNNNISFNLQELDMKSNHDQLESTFLVFAFVRRKSLQSLMDSVYLQTVEDPTYCSRQFLNLKSPYFVKKLHHPNKMSSFPHIEKDDDVQQCDNITLSLLDKLNLKRIVVAARGRACKHLECFDLASYLEYCHSSGVWQCPQCDNKLPFCDIRIDHQMNTLLSKISLKCNKVKVKIKVDAEDLVFGAAAILEPLVELF